MQISRLKLSSLLLLTILASLAVSQGQQPPADADISLKREYVLGLINGVRQQQNTGLEDLYLDDTINPVAQAHSDDMCARNFFSHNNPDGKTPAQRLRAAGLDVSSGENIAYGSTLLQMHNNLMKSPSHYANTIKRQWKRLGVGITVCTNRTYLTLDFVDRDFAKFPVQPSEIATLQQQLPGLLTSITPTKAPAPRYEDPLLSQHIQAWIDAGSSLSILSYLNSVNYQTAYRTVSRAYIIYSQNAINDLRSGQYLTSSNLLYTKFGVGVQYEATSGRMTITVVYAQ